MSNIYHGNPIEHAQSFANIQQIIRNEAGAALGAFEGLIESGWTEQEIVDDWNRVFEGEHNKFKDYAELEEWLMEVGI